MKKTNKILILLSFIALLSCKHKTNEFFLTCDRTIKKENVKVKMEVIASLPIAYVFDGTKEFNIPAGYGENEWYIIYKDSLHAYFRHFKTNRNDRHIYKFNIHCLNGKYFVDIDIKGVNTLKETLELK